MKTPSILMNYTEFPKNQDLKHEILCLLIRSPGKLFTYDQIGDEFGLPEIQIGKTVESLITEGFPIKITTEGCVKFSRRIDMLFPPIIDKYLTTKSLGRKILYTTCTSSTNDDARTTCNMFPDGTLLISETQTRGKGRLNRQWSSPKGGIFLSAILKPKIEPLKLPPLALVIGLAITKVLSTWGLNASIKWPNDILVNNRKVAGILCELVFQPGKEICVVIGIGINANITKPSVSPDLQHKATSLLMEMGKPIDRNLFVAEMLNMLEIYYLKFLESGIESLIFEIQQSLAYLNEIVVIYNALSHRKQKYQGTIYGLDTYGRLLLCTVSGEIKNFTAGELSLRLK